MSGPKVIRYTMDAFKGSLKDIMRLQVKLTSLSIEIQKAVIDDEELNVHFDCRERYKIISADVENALKTMVFDYKGTFDAKTYGTIAGQINKRAKLLSEAIEKCETILTDFQSKQTDCKSYKDYKQFVINARESFEKFKADTSDNLDKNFSKEYAGWVEEAKKKYGVIEYEPEIVKFNWGFDKQSAEVKDKVTDQVNEKENLVKEIRLELMDKIINTGNKQTPVNEKKKVKDPSLSEIDRVSQKIDMLIRDCDDAISGKVYIDQFNKLKQSESMNSLFFYQELHDRILELESSRRNKLIINDIIAHLNACHIDKSLYQDKERLLQKSLKLLNHTKVSGSELSALKDDTESLFTRNRELEEEAAIKKKENLFMKSQIILNLENLGYEVMEDLNVIDFEKNNDFYLKAPGQENLLNIKFKDDGSFRYVFEIPQKKEELSVEEQKMKLHEMKTTCSDFMTVLGDLKKMGVTIDLESEKPVCTDSMITIPESVSAAIKKDHKQQQRKEQIKKLYLE